MLGKLISYDFKALNRVMLPLQGGVLLAGIFSSFLLNFSLRYLFGGSGYHDASTVIVIGETIASTTASLLSTLLFAAIFASWYVTIFLVARHLYKNYMGDEGYLSFTLPVTAGQSLLSKLIAGTIWLVINALVLIVVVVLLSLIAFSPEGIINYSVLDFYREIFSNLGTMEGFLFFIELLFMGLVFVIFSIMQVYFALIMGGCLARNYKVLAGIGIYIATTFVTQIIMTFVMVGSAVILDGFDLSFYSAPGWFISMQPILIPLLILYVVLTGVFFFVSARLLQTKLNLD